MDIIVVFSEGVAAITDPSLFKIIDLLISLKKLSGLGAFFIPTSSKSLTHWIADPSKEESLSHQPQYVYNSSHIRQVKIINVL